MAQDDNGDKTEQPTPRRRQEAREEGQVARSQDLTAAVSLLAGLLLVRLFAPSMLESWLVFTRALGDVPDVTAGGLATWTRRVLNSTVEVVLPLLFFVLLVTVAGSVAQSGLLLVWKKLALKPERLNPVKGVQRLFSTDSVMRLVMGLFKVILIGLVAYITIAGRIEEVLAIGTLPTGAILARASGMLFELAVKMALLLLVLGLIDYFIQRIKFERQLRMTRQEVRDELKRMEGDPLLKQRRREMQRRLAMQRIGTEVPKADVVVTNPTEFAVALRYEETAMAAPRLVAKGQDYLAMRIRQVAQQHGVPVVERPPLARALYADVDVGQEVPPKFYRAVAELLAYIYQLTNRAPVMNA